MKELEDLRKKYPFLNDVRSNSCYAYFGFECNNGWYDIVDELCGKIQKYIDENSVENLYVAQIKEKFGGLRFYVAGGDSAIHGFIAEAERKSFTTCEMCGEEGKNRDLDGWLMTLCERHYEDMLAKKRK